jgi:predicted RNase H-like HicB family nuclease
MPILKATIESLENGYSAFIENLDGVVATGSTIEEIRANLIDAVDVFIETCRELGCEVPEELTGDYEIEFTMDVKSLLGIYYGIFTKAGLERITGINQKQLWHYANGISTPRRAQVLKIENALHRLGKELISLHL